MSDSIERERPSRLPAVIAALAVAVLLWPLASLTSSPGGPPVFPRQVASYSWWTPMLGPSEIGTAAMIYQNGFGVEFGDVPQAVVLGADGTTYRRLGAAEARTVRADQGDPADALLSADGTFAVISGPGRDSSVEVLDLRSLSGRAVPIGEGRSAIAVSIDSAGERALLLTSDQDMSRYTNDRMRLSGTLTVLDLTTGASRDLAVERTAQSAAVSPDGEVIAAQVDDRLLVVDASDGRTLHELPGSSGELNGDAWSPSGRRFAVVEGRSLRVVDIADGEAAERTVALPDDTWSSLLGWRDERTALLHVSNGDGSNDSWFTWFDVEDGAAQELSAYTADPLTGAALGAPDVARGLVGEWRSVEASSSSPVGPLPIVLVATIAGLVVWTVTAARSRSLRLR